MTPLTHAQHPYWLALTRSHRVGPATFRRLLDEYGTPEAAYAALPSIAAKSGAKSYRPFPLDRARRELDHGRMMGLHMLFLGSREYPSLLASSPQAPPFLWAKGNLNLPLGHTLAIVGARNASSLGMRFAKKMAQDCAQAGMSIVSGMARGIDTAAHEASLTKGTLAVLAGGVDLPYPQENQRLYEQIIQTGLILSEQSLGHIAQARHFPQRNRIIAGLAKAVLVIEGASKSGSLITAGDAGDLGREVLAVPGHPMDARSTGCNQLIRDGAVLIRTAQDVIDAMGPAPSETQQKSFFKDIPKAPVPIAQPHDIMNLLTHAGIGEDMLLRETGMDPQALALALTELEISGQIERQAGGLIARIS